jgi:hypothetical protein
VGSRGQRKAVARRRWAIPSRVILVGCPRCLGPQVRDLLAAREELTGRVEALVAAVEDVEVAQGRADAAAQVGDLGSKANPCGWIWGEPECGRVGHHEGLGGPYADCQRG